MIKNELVKVGSYCFMDYETTGVDISPTSSAKPIQIGCIFTDSKLNVLVEYERYIKWNSLMTYDKWPPKWQKCARIHKIPLDIIKEEGLWAYEVKNDIIEICSDIQDAVGTKQKCAIISDAPQFEMFFTDMIMDYMDKADFSWPFRINAWSIHPLFDIFKIPSDHHIKPHNALGDARILYENMVTVFKSMEKLEDDQFRLEGLEK
jgi:hypothetical protein